jgi:hypothetical protein
MARRFFEHFLLLSAIIASPRATSGVEPPAKPNPDLPRAVIEFCDQAAARDRGVANHRFAGSTDRQLALFIVLNEPLRQQMKVTNAQAHDLMSIVDVIALVAFGSSREEFVEHAARLGIKGAPLSAEIDTAARRTPGFVGDLRDDSDPSLYYDLAAQEELLHVLTKDQQDQLDVLYLNAEGLMALHRRHLASRLSLSRQQHETARKALHGSLEDNVNKWHRAHWGLSRDEATTGPPIIRSELRRCSLRIDYHVLALLKPQQLEQLSVILDESWGWTKYVVSTGMDCGPTLKDIEHAGK